MSDALKSCRLPNGGICEVATKDCARNILDFPKVVAVGLRESSKKILSL